ncbi:hypothetical protein [Streptosporangium sp. NPDC003464]
MIEYDLRHRIWLLSTPTTAYALGLDDGTPRHVRRGPPLALEQAAAGAEEQRYSRQEACWQGLLHQPPSAAFLQVDGVGSVKADCWSVS